jgi:TatD DNase family protein
MLWIDTHAHLQDEEFEPDRQAVLERAATAGVGRILLPASNLEDSRQVVKLALTDSRFICSIGCHPHDARHFSPDTLDEFRELMNSHGRMTQSGHGGPIVAVGEIGLDYHYDFSPRLVQQAVFRSQLELAWECRLPVIIHERESTADCLEILSDAYERGQLLPAPGVFHCFSGSPETAAIILKMGFYIGIDGPVTFKNARKLPDVIRQCPHDRLLLETDSPYLAPVPHRGQRNEPAFLPLIGAQAAEIWQIPVTEVARLTTDNAIRLFNFY